MRSFEERNPEYNKEIESYGRNVDTESIEKLVDDIEIGPYVSEEFKFFKKISILISIENLMNLKVLGHTKEEIVEIISDRFKEFLQRELQGQL